MGAVIIKSILSNDKRCFVCGRVSGLHRHHIYSGVANRPKSEKHGCWIYLCGPHHNLSNGGIHFNRELDLRVKRACQTEFEKAHTREEFIKTFGKSYL